MGRSALRLWSGLAWTWWTSNGTTVVRDPLPVLRSVGLDDLNHLMFVEQVFLPEVCASGAVTPRQLSQLWELLHALTVRAGESTAGAAQTPGTVAPTTARSVGLYPTPPSGLAPPQPAHAAEQPTVATSPPAPARPAETPVAPARAPSALSRWWTRTREGVGSDLAVHGLAYLGVLLFFTGAFGLVAFTFADVAPTLRWVSEIVIASAPFISAALLLRRGAVAVGRALEVGGGLLLPVMVITTFLDGVAFPPDLTGAALVATLTACCASIGTGYALWSGAHPAGDRPVRRADVGCRGPAGAAGRGDRGADPRCPGAAEDPSPGSGGEPRRTAVVVAGRPGAGGRSRAGSVGCCFSSGLRRAGQGRRGRTRFSSPSPCCVTTERFTAAISQHRRS